MLDLSNRNQILDMKLCVSNNVVAPYHMTCHLKLYDINFRGYHLEYSIAM